ncbi:MAG: hypothetical protein GY822_13995 [Deltaproteobacteria bacterium]|nr:hypothetical protein [Deltaproteobacteria bacterium]
MTFRKPFRSPRFLFTSTMWLLFLTASLSSSTLAKTKEKPSVRIAVLWTTGDDVKGATRSNISQRIRTSLRKNVKENSFLRGKAGVGNRKGLVRVLQEDRLCRPTQRGCERKVARALDATHYILGDIGRNEDQFEIKLSLYATKKGALLSQESGTASNLRSLVKEAPFIAEELTTEIIALVKAAPPPSEKKEKRAKRGKRAKRAKRAEQKREKRRAPQDELDVDLPEVDVNDDEKPARRGSRRKKTQQTKVISAKNIIFKPNSSQIYATQFYGELRIEDDLLLFVSAPDSLVKHDFSVPLWKIRDVDSALLVPGILLVEEGVDVMRSFSFSLGHGEKDRFLGKLKVAMLKSKKRHAAKKRR